MKPRCSETTLSGARRLASSGQRRPATAAWSSTPIPPSATSGGPVCSRVSNPAALGCSSASGRRRRSSRRCSTRSVIRRLKARQVRVVAVDRTGTDAAGHGQCHLLRLEREEAVNGVAARHDGDAGRRGERRAAVAVPAPATRSRAARASGRVPGARRAGGRPRERERRRASARRLIPHGRRVPPFRPATVTTWPVTWPEIAGEARGHTCAATSSGCGAAPSTPRVIGDSVQPGATAFTRSLRGRRAAPGSRGGGEVGQVRVERLAPALERQLPHRHVARGPDTGDRGAHVEGADLGEEAVPHVGLVRQIGRATIAPPAASARSRPWW